MKYLLRSALLAAAGCFWFVSGACAQHLFAPEIAPVSPTSPALVEHAAPGYLGVACTNVQPSQVAALKLKSASGIEVLEVDHDAPAGKAGIRPHDVILKMNGRAIAGVQQLREMLAANPAGTLVTLLISRNGADRTVSLRLADRAVLERNAWSPVTPAGFNDPPGHTPGAGFTNSFLNLFGLGSPVIGVNLAALGPQLADYFGVSDGQGLLIKRVEENSPASRAGLRAGDVIISVNGHKMATLSDWMKMVHTNRGDPMRVTFVRARKQQTTTLLTAKKHSEWYAPPAAPLFHTVSTAG